MFAPAIPMLLEEFQGASAEVGTLAVSIYLLGFSVGAMVLAPLSELYGRVPVVRESWLLC